MPFCVLAAARRRSLPIAGLVIGVVVMLAAPSPLGMDTSVAMPRAHAAPAYGYSAPQADLPAVSALMSSAIAARHLPGAVVMVGRERPVGGAANASTAHYDLTSLRATAEVVAGYIRNHWGIENGLHWVLDVSFREDESRARAGHAGANLGTVRRVARSLLKRADTKGSIPTRRMKAAWDDDDMLKGLQEIRAK